jgi:unspecific monooxygenase
VRAILRDRRFGRDVRHAVDHDKIDQAALTRERPDEYPNWTFFIRGAFIDLEPPDHTRLRRLVQAAFSKRASESYRLSMEETAEQLLDRAIDKGSMDAIADYATPIPLAMIADLMGVPTEDQMQLVDWSTAIVKLYDMRHTAEDGVMAEEATLEFVEYMRDLISKRKEEPRSDLVTALMHAEEDGDRLTPDEVIATSILALNAGHEATVQAIGNSLLALARNPREFQHLREEPEMIGTAIEELLRYDTPLQMFERWVLEDSDWDGVHLAQGTKVGLLFGSANHDEDVFDEPERLDLARRDNPHVSFGGGIHFCVGAPLAKVELDVAISHFARRISDFEITTDHLERPKSLVFRGVSALPMSIKA